MGLLLLGIGVFWGGGVVAILGDEWLRHPDGVPHPGDALLAAVLWPGLLAANFVMPTRVLHQKPWMGETPKEPGGATGVR